jgi:16S rRNA (cytosine1402-N4)-methyltransferase
MDTGSSDVSAMTNEYRHTPVLLSECLEHMKIESQHTFVDATLGGAGHSFEVAQLLGPESILIGIDQDDMALSAAGSRLGSLDPATRPRIELLKGNFGNLDDLLLKAQVPGIDTILFDLGVSSPQLDLPSRGFSFKQDAPLDMRMDPDNQTTTAAELINTLDEAELARIIRDNSDERWASRIAHFIVARRDEAPIETSGQLVEIIKQAIPASARRAGGHPAKRTFQALRIEVNGELTALRSGLEAAIRWLNPGGRILVISYHSLEDRIVKNTFHEYSRECTCPPDLPVCVCGAKPVLDVITRKPIVAGPEEVERNPRSRSAKLRVAEKRA